MCSKTIFNSGTETSDFDQSLNNLCNWLIQFKFIQCIECIEAMVDILQ